MLFTRSTVITPIYLLGFDAGAINFYVIWVGIQGVLIHANTGLSFGPLRYLFATPHFHHWHHAADAEAIDKNFGVHLPWFDRWFGTAYLPTGRWPSAYGIEGDPVPESWSAQVVWPFRR